MLQLLDRLAKWWINRRISQEIEALKKTAGYKDLELHHAEFGPDGFSADCIHENIAILAANAAEMLDRSNAKNYFEFLMYPKLESGMKPIEVIIRWYNGGKTPAQVVDELQAELDSARAFHPRAMKLIGKKKPFIVIACDEPYYMMAYNMIRTNEVLNGTWTDDDERLFEMAEAGNHD